MSRPRRATTLAAALFVLFTAARAHAARTTLDAERIRSIDTYMTAMLEARRISGAAIAVVQNGEVVHQQAYGLANLETGTRVTVGSVFQITSVTKPLTATAVLMLAEEGKLRLDDSIGTFIERAPPAWSGITVRHLLNHTAGIVPGAIVRVDSAGRLTTRRGVPLLDISGELALRVIEGEPTLYPAGERMQYCDACYFLLGLVIEKAGGRSYADWMQSRIFAPLRMAQTGILDRWRIVKGSVPVYTIRNDQLAPWRRDWQYEVGSFAGIQTTVEDLATWDIALRGGRVLGQGARDAMWTPTSLNGGRPARMFAEGYGLGWTLGEFRGHRTAEHAGASGAYVLHFLDDELTVVVLTNLESTYSRPGTIALGIAGLVSPRYQWLDRLVPQPDPAPDLTRAIRAMLTDMASGRAAGTMTREYRTFYETDDPRARQEDARLLQSLGPLTYLVRDEVTERSWKRFGNAVASIVHYRGDIDGKLYFFSFWLTAEGSVADVRFRAG